MYYFSLLKAGKGTIDAIHEISRLSGIGENRFSYAGLKDAFGITSQVCLCTTHADCYISVRTLREAFMRDDKSIDSCSMPILTH